MTLPNPSSGKKDTALTPETNGTNPILTLTIQHRLPSVNQILAMSLRQRMREKIITQVSVLCELRAIAFTSAMSGTSLTNISRIASLKLGCSLMTPQNGARSKSPKYAVPSPSTNAPQ